MKQRLFVPTILAIILLVLIGSVVLAQEGEPTTSPDLTASPDALAAAVNTSFTYQGSLLNNGSPVSKSCDFTFTLWTAATGGVEVGTNTRNGVSVVDGLFTLSLDFGAAAFKGNARWLQIQVACGGHPVTLNTRQPLTAAPYALGLRPGATIAGTTSDPALTLSSTSGNGLHVASAGANGVHVDSAGSDGLFVCHTGSETTCTPTANNNGVEIGYAQHDGFFVDDAGDDGVHVDKAGDDGVFVSWAGDNGVGVYWAGDDGIHVDTAVGHGVYVNSAGSDGVHVDSADANGVHVDSADVNGVYVNLAGEDGFVVEKAGTVSSPISSSHNNGLEVRGAQGSGVYVGRAGVNGVTVNSAADSGVYVGTVDGNGLHVLSAGLNGVYVASAGDYAGKFVGDVDVTGALTKGSSTFKIDHPLDPENQYLSHSVVESPDMMNIYNGNATLDAKGEAWVSLPDWFGALNQDFRYQLTAIGAPGPNLYIAEEVKGNRFKIAGGEPGMKVSWQVTGIRHDPYAEMNRILVEESKPADELGTYLHPDSYGLPENRGLAYKEAQEMGGER